MDKSYLLEVIDLLRKSGNNQEYKLYAVVAPSISSQFSYAKLGQVISAIKELGFYKVVEAALGADMVAMAESRELIEKGFLTTSCCPAFVTYVRKNYPELMEHVSHNLSPMAAISKRIKEADPQAKIVFIGPCTAKKLEIKQERVRPYVDSVLTFEELQALFDSRSIDPSELPEEVLDNASYYGRIFARSCGVTDAVREAIREQGITDFHIDPVTCDGIEQCRTALLRASKGRLQNNFIEGMACVGGCIGGAGCLTHDPRNKDQVDKYGKQAERTILEATEAMEEELFS